MTNKKAISHIEVILSFVIFTGFLIFLFAIFNPFKPSDTSRVYLDVLERGVSSYTKTDVSFITISINLAPEEIPGGCFYFNYNFSNVIVKDKNDDLVEAYSQPELGSSRIYINGRENFYYIYSSDEFVEKVFSGTCTSLPEAVGYDLGLFRSYKFVSNNSLTKLALEYASNYEGLKQKLGMPVTEDFSLDIKDTSGNILLFTSKSVPKNVKILAREVPVQLVYSDGGFKTAVLNIKVW